MSNLRSQQPSSKTSGMMLSVLMKMGKWKEAHRLIRFGKNELISIHKSSFRGSKELVSQFSLACRYRPPLGFMNSLLELYPLAAFEVDYKGRTPLHLLCQYGASPNVVKAIFRNNPQALLQKDAMGMLPIHKVCSFYYKNTSKSFSEITTQERMINVIKMLLSHNPKTIQEKDDNEKCPIEHALESGVNIHVIKTLQVIAARVVKKTDANRRCYLPQGVH